MAIAYYIKRMLLTRLLIFGCFLFPGKKVLLAQEAYPAFSSDMLKKMNPVLPGRDTAYIHNLLRKGNRIIKTQPDSAIAIYHQVYRISALVNYAGGRSMAFNNISSAYKEKNEFDKALFYLRESIKIDYPRTSTRIMEQYVDLFDLYYNKGNLQAIKAEYARAIPAADLHTRSEIAMRSRLNKYIAIAHFRSGNYDSSFYFYYQILNDLNAPDSSNFTTFVEIYNGLGAASARTDAFDNALAYFDKALTIARQYKDTNQICMSLGNKAGVYVSKGELAKAKAVCLESLAISRKMNYHSYRSLNAYDMAVILNKEGAYQEALVYCEEARINADKIKQFDNQIAASYITGYTYTQLKQYREAESYLLPAIQLAREKGVIENISDACMQLADVYKHTGRYREAYTYMEFYTQMRDSLRGKESAERIAHVEMKYKTEKKDKLLAQQQLLLTQKENKLREKNIWIGGVAITGFLLLALAFGKYRSKQKLQAEQLRSLAQQQEIERLNSRMEGEEQERGRIARELHDGVSVLLSAAKMNYTAIGKEHKELAETETYKEVMHLLQETGQEVRSITYNLVPELLIQQSLPAAVQAFCELIQRGHDLNIKLQSYGAYTAIAPKHAYAIYRIIQELIHNIVKHAHATTVLVQLMLHDNTLHITVEDNGIGFEEDKSPAGMGLQNLRSRIENLNGYFSFVSRPDMGTAVEIEIPITAQMQV
jgi:signal transduction histidine kinase